MKRTTRTYTIYALSDPRTAIIRYIGVSVRPKARYNEHVSLALRGGTRYVSRWIQTLLAENLRPTYHVLEECTAKNWTRREQYWIAYYKSDLFAQLTNLTDGGEGFVGYVPSTALREKWSRMRRGRTPTETALANRRGWKHTEAARAKIAAANRRPCQLTTRAKIAAKSQGRNMQALIERSAQLRRGVPLTPEHRAKITAKVTNRKPVLCRETGVVYPSITAVAHAFAVNEASVYQAIRKGCRCKGLHWAFLETEHESL